MKKFPLKNILIYSLTLLIIIGASIGGTYAYLTDKQETENILSFGEVDILLEDSKSGTGSTVVPGSFISRQPSIKNVGDSAAFVRLEILVSDAGLGNQQTINDFISLNKNTTDWDWSYYNTEQMVYYKKILQPGETTNPAITGFSVAAIDSGGTPLLEGANNNFKLIVNATAVQSDLEGKNYTDPDAWQAFDDMMP